jgi:DNA polymerase III sliding clamp (beta) subunit (PCNA family)
MQFLKTQHIETAVSSDELRIGLQNVQYSGHHLIATDGHILAVVNVEREEGDADGFISPVAFKAARKLAKRTGPTIKANGKLEMIDGTQFPRPTPGVTFPKVGFIVKGAKRNNHFKVAINASLLLALSEALGSEKLELTFSDDPTKAIFVEPQCDEKAYGVIMPIHLRKGKDQ